jgi:hypothetical protein
MRRMILLLSLALAANGNLYGPAQAQGAGNPPPPPQGAPSAANPATSPENCGTPDRFLPCPPLPRHPLPYFPANHR